MEDASPDPLQVFISYAHEDEELCREFLTHLSQLQRDGLIREWHDRKITGGSEWAGQIDEHLNAADIIVLLVSPDFLASQYCYDVEMDCALKRHKAGKARVVPVILRPSDWKTSPFSKLNALPTDGKPVVDWKTHDHGFLNVIEGLRRISAELREPAAVTIPRVLTPMRRLRSWQLVVACVLIVFMITAGWIWWVRSQRRSQERRYVSQGDQFLDVGRYEDARGLYQQALALNPANPAATLGIKVTDLTKLRPDAVRFERQLKELLKEAPHDPHLRVLEGDYFVGLGRLDEAKKRYEQATTLDLNLAEAWFRLGVIYDYQRNITRALEMYKRAFDLAPSSPQYACNLADQYFKHGEYPEAIKVYGRIPQFPLAALESAKIYRLLGELKEANDEERIALESLDTPSIADAPENQLPWSLDYGGSEPLTLATLREKTCYANLELFATSYLGGDGAGAKDKWDRAVSDCGARLRGVQAVVGSELQRLADERDEVSEKAAEFRNKFLSN
jgi:tetratricopeptide (TPR) repeat protein